MWHLRLLPLAIFVVCAQVAYVELPLNTKFSLGWMFEANSVQFTFKVRTTQCKLSGWCGIGFGPGMTNTDMLVASTNDGNVTVWDMWASGNSAPSNDTVLGGVDNALLLSGNYSQGVTTAVFTRALNTSDHFDSLLYAGMVTPLCFAYYDRGDTFQKHRYEGSGTIAFGTNQSVSFFFPIKTYSDDYQTHGIMLGVAWMPVMLISLIAARHFKYHWLWYWVHLAGGLFTLVVNYIYGMWAYTQDKPVYEWTTIQWLFHNRLGLTLMAFLPLQVVSGLLARFWTWKTTSVQALSVTRRLHYVSGWALMVTAQIGIYYGLQGYKPLEVHKLHWAFSVLGSILIAFEIRHWAMSIVRRNGFRLLSKPKKMTYTEVFDLVAFEGRKLIFFDNLVLDIGPFIDSHPGGSLVLTDSLAEDHGKYIYGVNAAGSQQVGFAHPQVVWNYISELTVGTVDCHAGVLLDRSSTPELTNMRWSLSGVTTIAVHTTLFSFVADTLYTKAQPEGVEWIGSHYRVSAVIAGTQVHRYYSLCLFFNVENLQRWYSSVKRLGFPCGPLAEKLSGANTTLDLVVKEYAPHGRMSTYLHRMTPGDYITISGPMGPGLLLQPDFTGHCCAFGAGTGVLPFLDLVEFLWWKELYAQGETPSAKYSALSDFSLTLYASFFHASDAIARDLMEATHRLCQSSTKPRFRLVLFFDEDHSTEPSELIHDIFARVEVKRVWICGPGGFCRWIQHLSKEAGIKRRSVIVM